MQHQMLALGITKTRDVTKAAKASVSGQSTIWFFLVTKLFQSFRADSRGVELYDLNRLHPEVRHRSLQISLKSLLASQLPIEFWGGFSASAELVL